MDLIFCLPIKKSTVRTGFRLKYGFRKGNFHWKGIWNRYLNAKIKIKRIKYIDFCKNELYNEDKENFEKYTKVRISNYIEEIEIKTPLNTIFSCNSPEGTTYGYKLCDLDDTLPRLLNRHKEKYIDGLYNCGGFDGDAYGYNSSFMSGIFCKDEIMKDIKESKNER